MEEGKTLSIITVCFNAEASIRATIESVVNQKSDPVEYIIIDGDSRDKTLQIIGSYGSQIDKVVSEPDKGIYDAMNKGIRKAQGKWILFLGADDTLLPSILSEIMPILSESQCALLYGDVLLSSGELYKSFFSIRTLLQNTVHHQGAFYNRSLFNDFKYDTSLRILSDYELNLKIMSSRLETKKLSLPVAMCTVNGASSQIPLSIAETNYVREKYVRNSFLNATLSWLLKVYYQQKDVRRYCAGVLNKFS